MNTTTPSAIRHAVAPVKEDPHLVTEQMRTLEQAVNLLREDEQDEQRVLPVLERLRHFFLTDLLAHMIEEEHAFLPAVAALPGGEGKEGRLRREHAELRLRIADFKSALTLAGYVGPENRPLLLWRIVCEARAILGRLKTHAAYEYELVRELNGSPGNGHQATGS